MWKHTIPIMGTLARSYNVDKMRDIKVHYNLMFTHIRVSFILCDLIIYQLFMVWLLFYVDIFYVDIELSTFILW